MLVFFDGAAGENGGWIGSWTLLGLWMMEIPGIGAAKLEFAIVIIGCKYLTKPAREIS